MAIAVTEAYDHGVVKDDPTYVKWYAVNYRIDSQIGIPMHKCSKEELNRFYEPRKD